MFNYYHLFIQFFAWIAASLYKKLKKMIDESSQFNSWVKAKFHDKKRFLDISITQKTFEKLKKTLIFILIFIHINFNHEFILYIDIYYKEIMEILYQISIEDNKKYSILYISWKFNIHEVKYVAIKLECLSMI